MNREIRTLTPRFYNSWLRNGIEIQPQAPNPRTGQHPCEGERERQGRVSFVLVSANETVTGYL